MRDNKGATETAAMQITDNESSNHPPVANAGPDQTITLPTNSINLSGSGTDADGTITAYQWTKVSGPSAGTIANINAASTTVSALVQGVYKFELKVTDNNGASARDEKRRTGKDGGNMCSRYN